MELHLLNDEEKIKCLDKALDRAIEYLIFELGLDCPAVAPFKDCECVYPSKSRTCEFSDDGYDCWREHLTRSGE